MASADTITIDLTNYRDRIGGRVPEGRYLVRVDGAEKVKSNAGNTMVNLFLVVAHGDYEGTSIVDRLVDTPKSQFRLVNFLQAIGAKTPRAVLNFKLRSWVGKYLMVDLEDDDPYKGRIKSVVRGYMRAEGATGTAADDRDIEDIIGSDVWPQPGDDDDDSLNEFGSTITDDSVEDVEYDEEDDDEEEDDELAGDDGGDLPLHDDPAEAEIRERETVQSGETLRVKVKSDDGDIDLEDLEL